MTGSCSWIGLILSAFTILTVGIGFDCVGNMFKYMLTLFLANL